MTAAPGVDHEPQRLSDPTTCIRHPRSPRHPEAEAPPRLAFADLDDPQRYRDRLVAYLMRQK